MVMTAKGKHRKAKAHDVELAIAVAAAVMCPEFEAHNSLGDAQATAWCWRHVQRDMLSRGGCDLEAEVRDASDASRCRSGAIKADRDRVVR